MRRIFLVAGLIACAGLAGCDEPSNTTAMTAVAPPTPSNQMVAAAPVAPAPTPVVHHRRHHHHRQSYAEYQNQNVYSGSAEYNGEPQVSQNDVAPTYQDQDAPEAENTQVAVWIDGYGRRHYGGPARAAAPPDSLERRKPWRGYDHRWDD